MSGRQGKSLTWAQRTALSLLMQRGRYLQEKDCRWSITPGNGNGGGRPTAVNALVAEVLLDEGAVEATGHLDRRWFKISDHGRKSNEAGRWL